MGAQHNGSASPAAIRTYTQQSIKQLMVGIYIETGVGRKQGVIFFGGARVDFKGAVFTFGTCDYRDHITIEPQIPQWEACIKLLVFAVGMCSISGWRHECRRKSG